MVPTLGFDIEFFVKEGDKIVPVCGKVGGNKQEHIKLKHPGNAALPPAEFEVHEDNVCLEINSPVFKKQEDLEPWFDSITGMFPMYLQDMLGLTLQTRGSYRFEEVELTAAGPQALEIGCDPDFDAYSENPAIHREVSVESFNGLRFAGLHIHLGYNKPDEIPRDAVAKLMDLITVVSNCSPDLERAKFYGPGLFRPKPYGVEYRSLSTDLIHSWRLFANAWKLAERLDSDPQAVADLYGQTNFTKIRELFLKEFRPQKELNPFRAATKSKIQLAGE